MVSQCLQAIAVAVTIVLGAVLLTEAFENERSARLDGTKQREAAVQAKLEETKQREAAVQAATAAKEARDKEAAEAHK